MFKISMGSKVKDRITGFTGIVDAQNIYGSGCIQYLVVPKMAKDGKYPEGQWIDEQRLLVMAGGIKPKMREGGGPNPTRRRATPPKR